MLILATYLMVLMNNHHALIRIYSRMVSCAFLVFSMTSLFLFPHIQSGIAALGFATFYTLLSIPIRTSRPRALSSMPLSVWEWSP